MGNSQARKDKRKNFKQNVDKQNPFVIEATIKNLKQSIRGNNPIADAALQAEIDKLQEDLKAAKGGNTRTEKRPESSRPWRK